jgi:cobalt-zinc-cadmium efflux system outer membrane protein
MSRSNIKRQSVPILAIAALVLAARAVPAGAATGAPAGAAPAAAPAAALDSLLARPSLDLTLLEAAVQQRNPSLEAMRSAWRAAEAAADGAGALPDPMVDAMTAPRSFGDDPMGTAYMVTLRQSFPLFGQRGLRGDAARATAGAAGEDYQAARLDLLRMTRDAYAVYYRNGREREVNRQLMDLVAQFRRIAMTKYEAGTANLNDALQADVELAMLDHHRVALERDSTVVVARLNSLLRLDPQNLLPDAPEGLPPPFRSMRVDSALALARATRPELRGLEEARRARESQLKLARRGRLPEFMIEAKYDRFMPEADRRPQIGAGISLPIQFGRIGSAIREAGFKLDEIQSKRTSTLYRIEYEVAAAVARVDATAHEIEVVEGRVVPATNKEVAAARAAYEANRADFLTLLNAERDYARALLNLYEVRARYFLSLADLMRAVGIAPDVPLKEESR